jgi:hypothetical protein
MVVAGSIADCYDTFFAMRDSFAGSKGAGCSFDVKVRDAIGARRDHFRQLSGSRCDAKRMPRFGLCT